MGRDVTGIRNDRNFIVKSNVVPFDCIYAPPMTSTQGAANAEFQEKKEVYTIKRTNIDASAPHNSSAITESMKPSENNLNVKPSPDTDASEDITTSPLKAQPQEVSSSTDKIDSSISNASEVKIDSTRNSNASEVEIDSTSNSPLPKKNDLPPRSGKAKQLRSPSMSWKSTQSDTDDDYHEEDNCSLASSTGSSVRSSKFKITVPVAPKLVSEERVARRKELNRMREAKQKALEAERRAFEARVKEEEEGEIKQLRKSMSYRANPVPKFYSEGPPPKAKLKKLPLTRPKSPNLSRRKSCGDAFNKPGPDGKRNVW